MIKNLCFAAEKNAFEEAREKLGQIMKNINRDGKTFVGQNAVSLA